MSWQPSRELGEFILMCCIAFVLVYPPIGMLVGRPIATEAHEFYSNLIMLVAGYVIRGKQ